MPAPFSRAAQFGAVDRAVLLQVIAPVETIGNHFPDQRRRTSPAFNFQLGFRHGGGCKHKQDRSKQETSSPY